ncbi:MAG: Fe(3+) dicitrate transport protein [Oleispira sp.]|jgi:Fe(3+) dicitrate transport protein
MLLKLLTIEYPKMKNLFVISLAVLSLSVQAADEVNHSLSAVTIIGNEEQAQQIAGSAHVIDAQELAKFEYTDIQKILASVPGVSFRNEDGYGLRPNISIRGTRDDRSGKITLMEDGVLIAPAPYSASSAYYFPTAGRISGIEVMKGSSAIKNGPYTVGGALNLLSTPIPETFSGKANIEYGQDNMSRTYANVGDSQKNYGWLIEGQTHRADGFDSIQNAEDETGFDKDDLMAKFRVNSDRSADVYHQVDLKLQYSTETSDQTYVGLTEADFKKDAHSRYGLTQQDQMDNEHKEITLSHLVEFGQTTITTTGYFIEFERDWFKVDKIGASNSDPDISDNGINNIIDCANGGSCGQNISTQAEAIAVLKGTAATDLKIKHNNRSYESKGIQTRIIHQLSTGDIEHKIELGARYHEDKEDRLEPTETWQQDVNGNLTYVSTGTPSTRLTKATAWSAYLSDDIQLGDWVVSPGIRYESYEIKREGSDTNVTEQNVTLLGLGTSYQVNNQIIVFAGLHEGHSPSPNDGMSDPEEALNSELGLRFNYQGLYAETTAFYSDYSNLLGQCTASGGAGDCDVGDASNAGEATVQGLEVLVNYDYSINPVLSLPVGITYTYTDATFDTTFNDDGVFGNVEKGDSLPNLADEQVQLRLGLNHSSGFSTDMNVNYYSATCATAACNVNEKIDAYTVVDLAGRYQINTHTRVYAAVENVFDSEDVVARAPKNGARAQKPLTALVGVGFNF